MCSSRRNVAVAIETISTTHLMCPFPEGCCSVNGCTCNLSPRVPISEACCGQWKHFSHTSHVPISEACCGQWKHFSHTPHVPISEGCCSINGHPYNLTPRVPISE